MSIGRTPRYKYFGASAALVLIASVAAQSLVTAQADRLGYVQANCPNVVKQALDAVSAQCSKAGRGTVCYGNSSISVNLQPGASAGTFSLPGDTLDVAQVKQLTLSSLDVTANTWGVAELRIKADLPDSDAAQFVTLVMFGSTQLTDANADANTAALSQTPGALARQSGYVTATTRAINQQATAGAFKAGATATRLAVIEGTATARAAISTPTGTIQPLKETLAAATAIKLANLIDRASAVPTATPVVQPVLNGPYKGGLQAFYFQSTDSAACDQAPHDGLLIQSPQGIKQRVTLSIDGATISLGSTVYVTAQAGKFMMVNTLEGSADVTAAGKTETALAGTAVHVPLDANLRPIGPPTLIQNTFYTADEVRAVPVQTLPTVIVPVTGLSTSTIVYTGQLKSTDAAALSGNCGTGSQTIKIGAIAQEPFKVAFDSQAGRLQFVNIGLNLVLTKTTGDNYLGSVSTVNGGSVIFMNTLSLHVTDPTTFSGQLVTQVQSGVFNGCTLTTPVTLTLTTDSPTATVTATP